jgi:Arc/MetJ family transcription regulator
MRTNIEIDDALIAEAMRLSGLPTKKATVEQALHDLIRLRRQREAVQEMFGSYPDLGDDYRILRGKTPRA